MHDMQVIVMLPATVRANFVKEIKLTCGNDYFSPQKKWRFIDIAEMQRITNTIREPTQAVKMFSDVTKVASTLIRRQKGVWVPVSPSQPVGGTDYKMLDDKQREAISQQLDAIIASKYNFIHYNGGLSQKDVVEMEMAPTNPFDNKVVIIDEVHNFVSRAIGPGKTGAPLYRLLLQAKNCKLLLLSGTPVVNHPYEAAAIVNLIKGPQTKYTFIFDKSKAFDLPQVKKKLKMSPYVDQYKVDPIGRRVSVWLAPEGFKFDQDKLDGVVKRDGSANAAHSVVVSSLERDLGSQTVKAQQQFVLPMDKDTFTVAFIDSDTLQVKRPTSLQRRMMGCISYYQTSGSAEYPTREPDMMTVVPMSNHMFSIYRSVREDEIQDEKRQRQRSEKANKAGVALSFLDLPSTYKSHSREVCNFVFPRNIKRIYKKKKNAVVDTEADAAEFAGEVGVADTSDDAQRIAALKKVDLRLALLKECSPKSFAMLQHVNACQGKCIIYSNFKIAEGLGHAAVALQASGWMELKLKRSVSDSEWEIDGPLPTKGTHTFFRYEADRQDMPLLMSIYNMGNGTATASDIPKRVLHQLSGGGASNASNKISNLRGELIKLMMFTKSGAEGLDLKHVRQVHVMEPYWHEVRIQQVIGRAIRLRSHAELPEPERRVQVFRYMTTMTAAQRSESRALASFDKGMTTDEIVFDVARRKHRVTLSVLACMKGAAVDCAFHKAHHKGEIACVAGPEGSHPQQQAFDIDVPYDIASNVGVHAPGRSQSSPPPTKLKTCTINGVPHVLSMEDMVVYDMDAYRQGQLQRVGHFKLVDAAKQAYEYIKDRGNTFKPAKQSSLGGLNGGSQRKPSRQQFASSVRKLR